MAAICGYLDKQHATVYASAGGSFLGGGAVTWLVSNATNPLVGGVVGAVSALVALFAENVLENMGLKDEKALIPFAAIEIGSSIALSLAATALGYTISIPLTLLLALTSVISSMVAMVILK